MPVKYKVRQKARFPIVTETPSLHEQKDKNLKKYIENKNSFSGEMKSIFYTFKGFLIGKNCLTPETIIKGAGLTPETCTFNF